MWPPGPTGGDTPPRSAHTNRGNVDLFGMDFWFPNLRQIGFPNPKGGQESCNQLFVQFKPFFDYLVHPPRFYTLNFCTSLNNLLASYHYNLLPFGVSQLWDFEIIGIVVNALEERGGSQVIRKVGSHCLGGAIHLHGHASRHTGSQETDWPAALLTRRQQLADTSNYCEAKIFSGSIQRGFLPVVNQTKPKH